MAANFIHLRVHSEYSIVDGIVRIPSLLDRVVADAMPAVALTDQTNLFALVKFYRAAMARGVKPIIGADFYVRHTQQRETSRLTLLCMNNIGYRNITELITKAYTDGQQSGLACIDQEWIEEHAEGLIALSGGVAGELGQLLLKDKQELTDAYLNNWAKVFDGRFYIELQRTGRENEETYNQRALVLAKARNMPVVATNDVRFISAEEFDAHEVRVCINQSRVLSDPRRTHDYSEQQYLRSAEEMSQLFSDVPSALQNTVEIAKRCNVTLEFGNNVLPEFPIPDAVSIDEYLRLQSDAGLHERLGTGGIATEILPLSDYHKRLEIELDVIQRMGYAGYFLIVSDFTRWARENDVPVGPGRGSGAGSLVAYVLGITDIDPLRYDLLFERFLNPERVSMPDFDIDFCMAGRDRVIEYVAKRYGREKVSQIITYGTMAAKAVVRDVGRVLGHSYGFVDRIAKMVPFEIGMTLKKALGQEKDFQALYDEEEEVRSLIDMALQLEGIARNAGKHAGGVVIAPSKLTDFTPLYCEVGGANIVTQLDKDDVEAIGLVKFDFLGLRTLTIIDGTVKSINRRRKKEKAELLELNQIPLDDDASYQLLQDQQTTAVFQLESSGIKDILGRLKPDKFDDVVAMVALYRPGPLQSGMVDDFIDRKHGAAIEYPHPDLEPILNQTYGVILYQEQVMQIAQVLAGYTLGGADLLRRAMGKKKASEMAKQRSIFVEGSTERGVDEAKANYIFDLMEKFAGYGFNKSHSVAYALLAYQTAWLKAHYPAEFMASVLSADMDNTDKVVNLIDECRTMGLEVMPPNLNSSYYAFTVTEEHQVVYGLGAIKGVGEAAVESLVQERAAGPYKTLSDLCIRLDLQKFNRRSLEAMIRSGAADVFMQNRATLMHALPKAVQLADQQQKNNDTGQNDLFGGGQVMAKEALLEQKPEWDMDAKLAAERETLGLYLTGHPVDQYRQELSSIVGKNLRQRLAMPVPEVDYRNRNKNTIKVAGLLMHMRLRNSPSGRIAFLTIDDNTARLDVAVFTDAYSRFKHLLVKDRILIIEGGLSIDEFNSQPRLRANEIVALEEVRVEKARGLVVEVDGTVTAERKSALAKELMATLQQYRGGQCHMEIQYQTDSEQGNLRLGEQWKVIPEQELLRRLNNLEGVTGIKVRY
ncbi:MAG: DNA polymerase III subunit alpha [Gammaproteobacteria bacterium]|nr:DNA polymerase III subunit alpha [Gammaproteobacteria bacterium]